MRLFINLFSIEICRAVFSKKFVICIFLMLVFELLSSSMIIFNTGFTVEEVLDNVFNGSGSANILLCLLPLVPFCLSYAKDMEDNAVSFYLVRANTCTYMLNRFFVACLSAFFCVVVSFAIFTIVLLCIGHPLSYNMYSGEAEAGSVSGYMQFLVQGKVMSYLIFYTMDRGLSAVMIAALAVFISTIYTNTFFTFTAPVCIYFMAVRFIFSGDYEHQWRLPSSWIEGTYDLPEGGYMTFFCKLGVALLVCIFFCGLSVFCSVRRWHYE